jgi:hypothetical protein
VEDPEIERLKKKSEEIPRKKSEIKKICPKSVSLKSDAFANK